MVVQTSRLCDLCRQPGNVEAGTLTIGGRSRRIDVCDACEDDIAAVAAAPRRRVSAAERVAQGLAGRTPPS